MLTAAIAVALTAFVITTWLLTIASHAAPGTDQATARLDAVRTGLAAGAGAGAAVGLMLAFRRQHHQEIATLLTDLDATERRIIELYTKAVEQLGNDKAPRSAIPEYRAYTGQVRQIAHEIVEQFRTPDWNPLILEVRDDYPRSLAACAMADVLLVNPISDGMNLVAQECPVLSQRGCALVLSRETGAAATLGDHALLVNPYDVSETAAALHQALAMPDAERQRRSAAAAAAAAAPPARWLEDQIASLGT